LDARWPGASDEWGAARVGEEWGVSDSLHLAKIKRKTIVAQVMEKIRQLISSGQFKAGDKIPTESEMAEMLGIGRSSIREAIKVFNYLGVLDSQTAKGTFVCDRSSISAEALTWSILLGRDDYYDLIDTRGAIETWALVSLAELHRKDAAAAAPHVAELEAQIGRMRAAISTEDREELARADYDFHATVIAGVGNALFNSVYGVLRAFMYEEIEKSHQDFTDISTIIEEHQEFVEAVRSGDSSRAMETGRQHVHSIKKRLENVLRK
jgi:GntR family transcriptional repressor for pyruvate dehydrogenase complex